MSSQWSRRALQQVERLEDRVLLATLDINGSSALTYTAAAGVANNLTISLSGGVYTFEDSAEVDITLTAGATGAGCANVNATTVTCPSAGLNQMTISLGDLADVVNVQSLDDPATLQGEAGDDTFHISSNAPTDTGTLDNILATVTVQGGDDSNTLSISDSGDADADVAVTITNSSVDGLAPVIIHYSATGTFGGGITIRSGTNDDVINIQSTLSGATTTVNSGAGNDTINVSSNAPLNTGNLSALAGTLDIDAGADSNSLAISESGSATADTVTVTPVAITSGVIPFTINYTATGGTFASGITLTTGSNDDTVNVTDTLAGATTTINTGGGNDLVDIASTTGATSLDGGTGTDTVAGPDSANTWNVTASDAGNIGGPGVVDFVNFQNLTGGNMSDAFMFGNGLGVTGSINGGDGADTLNYSSFAAGNRVTANLETTEATGIGITFSNIESIVGGAASDILIGPNALNTWNITANNAGSIGAVSFSSMENLVGGTGTDSFDFAAGVGVSGTIHGGESSDTLNYGSYTTAVASTLINGGAFGGPLSGAQEVPPTGSAATGTARLTIDLTTNLFSIDVFVKGILLTDLTGAHIHVGAAGVNGGVIFDLGTVTWYNDGPGIHLVSSGLAFPGSNVADLLAGDTYVNLHTAAFNDGEVRGQLLVDSRNFGSSTGTSGFASIESLTGGSATDSLTGLNAAATWGLDGTNDYTSGSTSLDFSDIENLNGGSAVDTFNVSADHTGNLAGAGGVDVFNLIGSAVLTGSVDGGSSATLDFSAYATARSVTLTGLGTIDGFAGNEASISAGFDNITNLVGSAAADTLTGRNAAATWGIDGTNEYTSGGRTLPFSAIENLTGGTASDTFNLSTAHTGSFSGGDGDDTFSIASGSVSGNLAGGLGTDSLSYAAFASAVTVNLATNTATGVGGAISGLESLTGSASSDTLVGANASNTWNVTANNAGNIGATFSFSAIENLTGGSSTDSFVLSNGIGVTGAIAGAGGNDTLDYSSYTVSNRVTVNLQSSTATGVGSTISSIESVAGGAASDILIGANAANTWTITSNNAGSVGPVSFSSIENLVGGTGTDSFDFAAGVSVSGTIHGADGSDTLNYGSYATAVNTTLVNGGAFGGPLSAGQEVPPTGSAATGTARLTIDLVTNQFSIDVFVTGILLANLTGAHIHVGAAGANGGVIFDLGTVTWYNDGPGIHLVSAGLAFPGGNVADLLAGNTYVNIHTVAFNDGEVRGQLLVQSRNFGSSTGTSGMASIESLTGGSATDSLTGLNAAATWGIDGTNDYTSGTTSMAFSGIENLNGGSAVDTFNVSANHTGNLAGAGGVDVFNFSGSAVLTGSVDGGSSATLDFSGYATARSVTLTGLGTIDGFAGTEASISAGFDNITNLIGSAASDTLTGRNAAATWGIDGTNEYTSGGRTLPFSAIENLTGGTNIDTFNLSTAHTGAFNGGNGDDVFSIASGSVSGNIDGSAGTDSLNYASFASAITVNLASNTATGVGGTIAGIESLTGSAASDTLVGPNTANTWNVTANNAGNIGGSFSFTAIENLTGGTAADEFILSNGVTVSGVVSGGAGGNDTLNYSAFTTAVSVNLGTGQATNLNGGAAGGALNIDTAIGGSAGDTLTAGGTAARLVGGPGNDTAVGGAAADTLVGGLGDDSLDGAGGSNWVDYSASATAVQVHLQRRRGRGEGNDRLISISNAIGSTLADKLIGSTTSNVLLGGAGNDTLLGIAGDDVLIGNAGADSLIDKVGRNVLIGGTGADTVTGGKFDDILIAGSTDFDTNEAAIAAILAEWSSTLPSHTYATRVANLRDGSGSGDRLNGPNFLTAATVHDDGAADRLSGKKALDWFLARTAMATIDTILDRAAASGELLDEI